MCFIMLSVFSAHPMSLKRHWMYRRSADEFKSNREHRLQLVETISSHKVNLIFFPDNKMSTRISLNTKATEVA